LPGCPGNDGVIQFKENNMSNTPVLISGASGRLGQTVVRTLIQQGIHQQRQLILVTRTPEKLATYEQCGVVIRYGDFDHPNSLAYAFNGVERILLISTNLLDSTGNRVQQHRHAIEAAKSAGVNHVVYTSFIQPLHGLSMPPSQDHLATEELIKQSGLNYTFLRNAFYYDMLLPLIKQAVTNGSLSSACGHSATAYIARHDCAKAAAQALISEVSEYKTLTLTGETINMQTLVAKLSAILQKPILHREVSLDQKLNDYINSGLPPSVAKVLMAIDSAILQGALDIQTTDFRTLTDTHPSSVTDFIVQQLAMNPEESHR
jgi:NAD(P)H dehydrogenase (quinone)